MSVGPVSFEPPTLNINLYAGDGAVLTIETFRSASEPLALTGELVAQIRPARTSAEILEEFSVDMDRATEGVVVLSLTAEQTDGLLVRGQRDARAVWDLEWLPPGGEPITLLQGTVRCVRDVTRVARELVAVS